MTRGEALIQASGVTKRFGALLAVDRVDYTLRENEIAGIIGSNGAGKTTFFNLLTGYFAPDEGAILYRGRDITRMAPEGTGLVTSSSRTSRKGPYRPIGVPPSTRTISTSW